VSGIDDQKAADTMGPKNGERLEKNQKLVRFPMSRVEMVSKYMVT
jgi:hypothetical protein